MRKWSRHARLTLPRKRSHTAFACGVRHGVRSTWMPLAVATRAKFGPNFLSLSRMRYFGVCPSWGVLHGCAPLPRADCLPPSPWSSWSSQARASTFSRAPVIYASRTHRSVHDASARSVSGWTRKMACFQARTILAKSTRRSRSLRWQTGRLICRRKMFSWCRNKAFSASSSALPLVRSASAPSAREVVRGLIQHAIRSWSTRKLKQTRCLMEMNTLSTN